MLNKIQKKMGKMVEKTNNFRRELESVNSDGSSRTQKYNI